MSKISTLDMWDVVKYVRAVANEAGLSIVWEDKFQPRTDGKRIYLPKVHSGMSREQADQLMYSADHECSHVLYSSFEHAEDGLSADRSFLGAINNALEDVRIDYKTASIYEGSKIRGDAVYADTAKQVLTNMNKKKTDPQFKETLERVGSLISWVSQAREEFAPLSALEGREMRPFVKGVSKDADKFLTRLEEGNYTQELKKIYSAPLSKEEAYSKVLALAERIFKEVYEEDPEQEKERCKQEAQQEAREGKGDKQGKKGEESKQGQGKAGKDRATKQGEGDEEGEVEDFVEVKWTAIVPDNHDRDELYAPKAGQHIDYSSYKEGLREAYEPSFEKTVEIDYVDNSFKNIDSGMGNRLLTGEGHYKSEIEEKLHSHASAEGFANRVRQLLQIRAKARTQYGVKQGKLHAGNINRITLKDAGSYGERIFKKKEEKDLLNISVSVVCDMSGSMAGEKVVNATVASMLLNHTLGNVLHIPIEFLGFTEYGHHNLMYIWRKFGNKLVPNESIVDNINAATQNMSGNQDGEAVVYAYERLKRQKTKRKLLIVLSDGSPASSKSGDDVKFLKDTIEAIQHPKSGIEIVGIGIRDDNVKRFYKENYVIKDSNQLEEALLNLIDKKLT